MEGDPQDEIDRALKDAFGESSSDDESFWLAMLRRVNAKSRSKTTQPKMITDVHV